MKTLIKYYDNLSEIIDTYNFEKKDEDIMLEILDLIIFLIIKEARKMCNSSINNK